MFAKFFILSIITFLSSITAQVFAQSPTAAAMRFNIFVKGDVTLTSSETEGPVAVGGDLTTHQYQISFDKNHRVFTVNNASIGLAVRGGIKLNSGSLSVNGDNYVKIGVPTPSSSSLTKLKTWYLDNNNAASTIRITEASSSYSSTPNITINANKNTWTPNVSETVNPVFENVFGTGENQIDIDGAFVTMVKRSGHLAALKDNLSIRDQNGNIMPSAPLGPYLDPSVIGNNPKIVVDPNKINVLTVSAAVWEAIKNSNIEKMPSGLSLGSKEYTGNFGLIINIVGVPAFAAKKGNSTINFPSFGGLGDSQASYVIYNFPDATETVTVGGNAQITGTIFTPQANLIKGNNGNINGQIIAKSFVHTSDEVHFWPFLVSIPEPADDKISVAAEAKCLKNAPWLEYTVTPNYDTKGKTATIEWINGEGQVVKEDKNQPLTGRILFPGATVDGAGVGNGYPGWEYVGSKWIPVSDLISTIRLNGAKIRVTVSPTQAIDITYPMGSATCLTSPPPTPSTPLPVTLSSFTAKNENCNVQLKWKVTEAKSFSHFVVQRSTDARTFVSLSTIPFNSASAEYSYTDTPFSAETAPVKKYYYRLAQVDIDESTEYSVIRSVDASQCDSRLTVDFYPNPTQNELNVRSGSPLKRIAIFTLGGKQISQFSPVGNQTEVKVNVQDFEKGIYIVHVVSEAGRYSSKIMKN
jgi:choice-of-anchor A domain-containing protein